MSYRGPHVMGRKSEKEISPSLLKKEQHCLKLNPVPPASALKHLQVAISMLDVLINDYSDESVEKAREADPSHLPRGCCFEGSGGLEELFQIKARIQEAIRIESGKP